MHPKFRASSLNDLTVCVSPRETHKLSIHSEKTAFSWNGLTCCARRYGFMWIDCTVMGCGGNRHMMHTQWLWLGQVDVSGLWLWLGDGDGRGRASSWSTQWYWDSRFKDFKRMRNKRSDGRKSK